MKSEVEVYELFYMIWEQFLRMKFPQIKQDNEEGEQIIKQWVNDTHIVRITDGELLCTFDAPVEWTEFKEYYDITINKMFQTLTKMEDRYES